MRFDRLKISDSAGGDLPTLKNADELRARANVSASREKNVAKGGTADAVGTQYVLLKHAAREGKNKFVRRAHLVVMPYNYEDNGPTSEAIGTKLPTQDPSVSGAESREQKRHFSKLTDEWLMWKSASRSSFVEVRKVDPGTFAKVDNPDASWPWRYDTDKPGRRHAHLMDEPFDMANFDSSCHFSIKTGVEWVGAQYQGNITGQKRVTVWDSAAVFPGKDVIEKNSVVAMLRSYHIRAIDGRHRHKANFGTQLEVLTVNRKQGGDGFQVRDLGCFDTNNLQFPALSVPYAGLEIVQQAAQGGDGSAPDPETRISAYVSAEFADTFFDTLRRAPDMSDEQKAYAKYWGFGYALMVGVVKAGLLLRYAIVPVTPNPQNFIIELDASLQPCKAIVRDVGDFLLHHEIAGAYWIEDSDWFGEVPKHLSGVRFSNEFAAIEYSAKVKKHYIHDLGMESGVLPYDTIFHVISGQKAGNVLQWGNNSTFKAWGGANWKDLGSPLNDRMMAIWGALHNEVFMKNIQDEVGIDLSEVRKKNQTHMLSLDKYRQKEEEAIFPDLQGALTTQEALASFRKYARVMNIA